jgi:3-dehydroquinate synthase
MDAMTRVTITVQPRPYDAWIEVGLLARAGTLLREAVPEKRQFFVVTVPPVRRKWGKKLEKALEASDFRVTFIPMQEGETSKTLATVERLGEKLAKAGADRNSGVIAFGGGVVGDVAGLLASLYMRGVDVIQIPTTLVAQVDASIGGKTGVNLRAGKNLLGTFHQPRAVLIDPEVLSSLPEREFRSGLYEALKCGVIGKPELFRQFEENKSAILKRDTAALERLITDSVELKAAVVSADERENGLRRVLNLGHTIGHALEAETGYRSLLHGEAVAWGMVAATNIALSMGRTDSVTAGRITDAVLGLGHLPRVGVDSRKILGRLKNDKKTRNGVVHFILPRQVGKVDVVEGVPEKLVIASVDELRRLSET